MSQPTHVRTVPAFGLVLLLCSLGAGGCACPGNGDLDDLGSLLGSSHRPPERCPRQVVVPCVPCDPCYGFHATRWHAWPECCPGAPGARPATDGASHGASLGTRGDMEEVPAPPQEPQVHNLPPPPDQPSARKLPVPPPAEGVKPPAAELPPAPLPDDDNRKPSKDQGNTDKPRKPQAQHRLKSRPVTICSASQQPQSGDVVNAKELVVLRQSMSPPSPHATSSATSPAPSATVPASAPSATSAQSSHWQEAVFTWFTSDELLRDGSAGRVPAAHNAASSAGHDVP